MIKLGGLGKVLKKITNLLIRQATEEDKKISSPKYLKKSKNFNRPQNNNRNQFQSRGQFRHPNSRGIQKYPGKFQNAFVNQNRQFISKPALPVIQETPEEREIKQKRSERFNLSKKSTTTNQEITID